MKYFLFLVEVIFFWILIPLLLIHFIFQPSLIDINLIHSIAYVLTYKIIRILGIILALLSLSYLLIDGGGLPTFLIPPKKLVKCGIYSIVRHPTYLSYILFILSFSLEYLSYVSIGVFSVILFFILIYAKFEEKKLIEKYDKKYIQYTKETPFIIPKLPKKDETCPSLLFILLYYIGHVIMFFLYRVNIEKPEGIPEEGTIVVSNHVTYIDFAFVVYALKRFMNFPISYVHYKRNEWFFKLVGTFPIKRFTADVSALKRMMKIIKNGGRVGIFPESERSWDGRFLGFKKGFDKFLEKLPSPYIAVRIENLHLHFPRWRKTFNPGTVNIKIKTFDTPKEVEEFLSKPSVNEKGTYVSYKGVEKYLYACPKCLEYKEITSDKNSFRCKKCDFELHRPTVEELWKYHDYVKEKISPPIFDNGYIIDEYGKKVKKVFVRIEDNYLIIDDKKIEFKDIKGLAIEGTWGLYFHYEKKVLGLTFEKTSPLLWREIIERGGKNEE